MFDMKNFYDKLQDSLEIIKITCEKSEKCTNCPLGDKHGTCKLTIHPGEWKPRHPDTDVFRVLE